MLIFTDGRTPPKSQLAHTAPCITLRVQLKLCLHESFGIALRVELKLLLYESLLLELTEVCSTSHFPIFAAPV